MLNPFTQPKFKFNTSFFKKKTYSATFQKKPTYPIVRLYEQMTGNTIQRSTNRYVLVLCPFHGEKKPSLALYTETNTYYCFSCHVHGDIFKFVMDLESKKFSEAVEYIKSL